MTTWYNASQGVVEAANMAMSEADDDTLDTIWRPVAEALLASIPEDFQRDWPELAQLADDAGPDFVGVTSDTRRVVVWGERHLWGREFSILKGDGDQAR